MKWWEESLQTTSAERENFRQRVRHEDEEKGEQKKIKRDEKNKEGTVWRESETEGEESEAETGVT